MRPTPSASEMGSFADPEIEIAEPPQPRGPAKFFFISSQMDAAKIPNGKANTYENAQNHEFYSIQLLIARGAFLMRNCHRLDYSVGNKYE